MSSDRMNDVFPILFSVVEGELPTAEKVTGAVKLIDVAFADITQAVGDPWDYQSHSVDLSLENLGITNLARIIGPSDYISPLGGCFNEEAASTTLSLRGERNSWNLGFPLVKISTDVTENGNITYTDLVWGTDITVSSDPDGVFTTEKSSPLSVVSDGDFYVNYSKGTIVAYTPISSVSSITLTLNNWYAFGAGVPWGTHNVIPSWNQTTNLCTVAHVIDSPTLSTWTITFPTVDSAPRVTTIGRYTGRRTETTDVDVYWGYNFGGYGSSYRLPRAITSASMTAGDAIPEGYFQLWDEVNSRVVPNVLFYYKDNYSLTITTPYTSPLALSEGSNYRVLASGTSLAEAVSYLLATQRFNNHAGLNKNNNATYTVPLSHDNLENLFAGELDNLGTIDEDAFKFRMSSYSTNCHPQYLHRAGYMADDLNGNTGNAMRGNIVFAGIADDGLLCGSGISGGNSTSTYGIQWGGPLNNITAGNTTLVFDGGPDVSTWSTGTADRYPFGMVGAGAIAATSASNERFGGLSLYSWYGTPLYLRGTSGNLSGSSDYRGAVLGFDFSNYSEANYLKLLPAYRSGTFDVANLPAQISQSSFSTSSFIMPSLSSSRISASQVRELRFRGVSYVSSATNTSDSLGGATTRGSLGAISEFQQYFTSPGVLGADFLNVYSNAIFFSNTGDGKATSFTSGGDTWLNRTPALYSESTGLFDIYMPTGIYYMPYSAANTSSRETYTFSVYDTTVAYNTQPLRIGDRQGFKYFSALGGDVAFATASGYIVNLAGSKAFSDYASSPPTNTKIWMQSDDEFYAKAATGSTYASLILSSAGGFTGTATGGISLSATATATLSGATGVTASSSGGNASLVSTYTTGDTRVGSAYRVTMYTGTSAPTNPWSGNSIYLATSSGGSNAIYMNTGYTGIYSSSVYIYPAVYGSHNTYDLTVFSKGYTSIRTSTLGASSDQCQLTLSSTAASTLSVNSSLTVQSYTDLVVQSDAGGICFNVYSTLTPNPTADHIEFRTGASDSGAHTGIYLYNVNGNTAVVNGTMTILNGEIVIT